MRILVLVIMCAVTVPLFGGCQALRLPQLMEDTTRSVDHASDLLVEMGGRIDQTNAVMQQLQPALTESVKLRAPMESMVAPILTLATLEEPMQRVAELGPGMDRLASLAQPMERVAALGTEMAAVAALDEPMQSVAALEPAMAAVAKLGAPMASVAALREPMQRVAGLMPSMERVAELKPTLDAVAALREPMASVADLKSTMADVADLKESMEQVAELKESLKAVADLNATMHELADAFDGELDLDLTPLLWGGLAWLVLLGLSVYVAVRLGLRHHASP